MTEMLEKVARAIDPDAWREDWVSEPIIVRERVQLRRDVSLRRANAVLLAMMEPTEAMLEAGVTAEWGGTMGSRVSLCFRAMIQAALNEGK